jgi:hypothetical protein
MAAPDVWVAKDDGSDIVRATAIAAVGRDYNGSITVRMSGGEQAVVTIVDNSHGAPHTPDDFHLQLLRMITRLSDTAEAALIRPVRNEADGGWKWRTGSL